MVDISRALAAVPQIELESLEWDASGAVTSTGPAEKSEAPKAAPSTPGEAPPQAALISGRINIPQSNDYRAITQTVDQFTEALRKQPGVEVVSRRLPFDIAAQTSLSGDIGTQRAAEVPRFTLVVSKRGSS